MVRLQKISSIGLFKFLRTEHNWWTFDKIVQTSLGVPPYGRPSLFYANLIGVKKRGKATLEVAPNEAPL